MDDNDTFEFDDTFGLQDEDYDDFLKGLEQYDSKYEQSNFSVDPDDADEYKPPDQGPSDDDFDDEDDAGEGSEYDSNEEEDGSDSDGVNFVTLKEGTVGGGKNAPEDAVPVEAWSAGGRKPISVTRIKKTGDSDAAKGAGEKKDAGKRKRKKKRLQEEMQSLLEEEVESQFKEEDKPKRKKKAKKNSSMMTSTNVTPLPSILDFTSDTALPTYELPPLVLNAPTTSASGGPVSLRPYTANYGQMAPKIVTVSQMETFRNLLAQHHQLLLQTCAVSVRRAVGDESNGGLGKPENTAIVVGEGGTPKVDKEEIKGECLNVVESSAQMMQKLLDCRVDAIRNSIEYKRGEGILPETAPSSAKKGKKKKEDEEERGERMTRAKFRNMLDDVADDQEMDTESSLQSSLHPLLTTTSSEPHISSSLPPQDCTPNATPSNSVLSSSNLSTNASTNFGRNKDGRTTVFESPSIVRTKQILRLLDSSVDASTASIKKDSVLDEVSDIVAIEGLLNRSNAPCNRDILPETDKGVLFNPPVPKGEKVDPMKFTKAEDSLLLQGVLKYGEKNLDIVCGEFLPTRKMEMLNRRYSKLFVMACERRMKEGGPFRRFDRRETMEEGEDSAIPGGIIQTRGERKNSKYETGSPDAASKAPKDSTPVPAFLMDEDVELWYCVSVSGRQFAEISKNFLPHFDRYNIRKRFMMLERRWKVAEKNEASIEPNHQAAEGKGNGNFRRGGSKVQEKKKESESSSMASKSNDVALAPEKRKDIKNSVEMAGEKVVQEVDKKKGKPGVQNVVPIASGGGGGGMGMGMHPQQQQNFMAAMMNNMMNNPQMMMQMMTMMMMSGGMGNNGGGINPMTAMGGMNGMGGMNPMMAMMMGGNMMGNNSSNNNTANSNTSNNNSSSTNDNNNSNDASNNQQENHMAAMMQMMMGANNGNITSVSSNGGSGGAQNQQKQPRKSTDEALMPPPRSRANSIDAPPPEKAEPPAKKKKKATKTTTSAKKKPKAKAAASSEKKGRAVKSKSKHKEPPTLPPTPTPLDSATSDPSLLGYSPSIFIGLPSGSEFSGQSGNSLMNLDSENSILVGMSSNHQQKGGDAVDSYMPGKNLLNQVMDNANRSNSNSNSGGFQKTAGEGEASGDSAWGASFENLGDGMEFSKLEFSDTTQAAFADVNGTGKGSRSSTGETPSSQSLLRSPTNDEMTTEAVSGLRSLSTPKRKRSLFDNVVKGNSGQKK